MELTRRDLLKGAAALGAAAAVPLTAGGSALAQTTQKKELVTAQSGDVSKFDPHFSTSSNDVRVSFNIFDNLVSRHPEHANWWLLGGGSGALDDTPQLAIDLSGRLRTGGPGVSPRPDRPAF